MDAQGAPGISRGAEGGLRSAAGNGIDAGTGCSSLMLTVPASGWESGTFSSPLAAPPNGNPPLGATADGGPVRVPPDEAAPTAKGSGLLAVAAGLWLVRAPGC